jgi:thiol-disulfide isomerase/thioredoxin
VVTMSIAAPCRAAVAVAVVVLSSSLVSSPARGQDGGIAVGAKAPSAIVRSLDGSSLDLSSIVGTGPTLVEFWAAWCPNCAELEPALVMAQKKYAGRVKFVTVAVAINESLERVRRHVAAHNMRETVVYDADGNAAGAYDAPATSYVVLIDRAGRVVYTGVGGTQDLEAAIRKAL